MNPDSIDQTLQTAVQLHQTGKLPDAERLYRQILARQPDNPDALHLLGMLTGQTGRFDMAVDLLRRAIASEPDNPYFHGTLGNALQDLGKLDESIAQFRKAIELEPNLAEAHNNLGNVLRATGKIDDAIQSYRQAIQINPNDQRAHANLGDVFRLKGDFNQAIPAYRQAIRLDPNFLQAWINLGNSLRDTKQFAEAIECHRQAARLNPNSPEIQINLATALRDSGHLDEAIAVNQTAIRLRPTLAEAHANLATALRDAGQVNEAIAAYRQALKIKPDFARAHSSLLFAMNDLPTIDPKEILAEHRAWAARFAPPSLIGPAPSNDRSPDRRLRVGYISGDFRRHSVAYFFTPLLDHRDRQQQEIFCYANVQIPDDVTERIQKSCDVWRNIVGMTDTAIADLIRSDRIDILVDLTGHTGGGRIRVFALKTAPIQITYLGYPNTTGLAAIDYRFTDALADPPGQTDPFVVEKLWRLPTCAWCYEPPADAPEIQPRQNKPITFGSFNALPKINPPLISIWAQILKQVPDARLLLKSTGAGESSSQKRVIDQFAAQGISSDRIDMRGRIPDPRAHLNLYNEIDIALDTYPYHGTTTTCESLWMGVPVITLAGQSHISRVGVSLLTNTNLPDLIAQSPDQYISIASQLARDASRLATLRTNLRTQLKSSPLLNGPRMATDIQSAYRQMWHTWCAARPSQ